MCLILFSWDPEPTSPESTNQSSNAANRLVVAANRDEFYLRPSKSAHFWEDNEQLLAGKDLQLSGTWLGITRSGRFAAVTNFRKPDKSQYPLSRGKLCSDFLKGDDNPLTYLQELQSSSEQYAGFNLIVGDQTTLCYYSNRSEKPPQQLEPGVYGLSNHLLNTEWPKVKTGVNAFRNVISREFEPYSKKEQALLEVLQNDLQADDSLLPKTGVGAAIEKMLSPLFIKSPAYGTRASTVVQMKHSGEINFLEQNYNSGGVLAEKIQHQFFC